MAHLPLILIFVIFLAFGLFSKKLGTTWMTPPMVFVASGAALSFPAFGLFEFEIDHHLLTLLLEATLVLVLFTDAAHIDLKKLKKESVIPVRMLLFGMPISMVIGTAAALLLPLGLTFCEAVLVAAILTPTDAALGQIVVSSKRVPEKIRIALSVESGLNDGIALPVVLIFASIASAIMTNEDQKWFQFAILQLSLGPLAGMGIGYLGSKLVEKAGENDWVSVSGEGIIALCIAAMCFIVAETFHGNGFIAAFIGGLAFGGGQRSRCKYLFEFAETEGQILTLGTFFIFGAMLIPMGIFDFNIWHWLFALFSLTVMRMLSVYTALSGIGMNTSTKMFLGWFGPRGLASILFVVLVIGETILPHPQIVIQIVLTTVLISVFAHGVSAAPLAKLYGDRERRMVMAGGVKSA